MKWVTHQTTAVAAALALHLPPAALVAVAVGAVLPDVLDQRLAGLALTRRGRQSLFRAIHRGTTHWFGWWLLLSVAALMPSTLASILRDMALGLSLGGLSHVLLDMLTPAGVPLFPFSRHSVLTFKLCTTGSLGEYAFLVCVLAASCFFLRDDVLHLAQRLSQGQFF